jgi:hypothetical protein
VIGRSALPSVPLRPVEYALARVVSLIVLPDLGQPLVREKIYDWASRGRAPPARASDALSEVQSGD